MEPTDPQLARLVDAVVNAVHPLRIILFGSAARGQANAESDVDLLVVMPEGTHRRRTAQHLYRVVGGVGVPFDVIVATPDDLARHRDNPGLIYKSILQEGRTVYAA